MLELELELNKFVRLVIGFVKTLAVEPIAWSEDNASPNPVSLAG